MTQIATVERILDATHAEISVPRKSACGAVSSKRQRSEPREEEKASATRWSFDTWRSVRLWRIGWNAEGTISVRLDTACP